MKELAPGVFQLKGLPPNGINVYVAGDVLIDAATKLARRRVMSELRGRTITAHALTHAHPDHQGVSHHVCTELGIPLLVGERDVAAMEGGPAAIGASQPPHPLNNAVIRLWCGPAHPVDRALKEGDTVGGFTVLDTPGHSAGHVSYWRESDRVLILGDVVNTMSLVTTRRGLQEPPKPFTPDPVTNRASIRRLAALEPALVLAGHGPPWRDTAAFVAFAEALPTP
ncbi:MAG: hydroxyacylglutathione hydrolase [Solirubrobacteraceae bacterium]|jgi:glyoxylase-like metal-dependent hydrolase (beta-lactamase superfamily II)|nr:hydroxyacylglutathione hydrolase [Solirubrobacteraceae bacterium]